MIFSATTDKLQLTTSSTAGIDVLAHYADMDTTTKAVTVGRQLTKITTATTTDIMAAPSTGFSRKMTHLSVSNIHASTSNVVALVYDAAGTDYVVETGTLAAAERLSYAEGRGMRFFDSEGREKTTGTVPAGSYTVSRLSATLANATTTAAKVTGLDLPCSAGTYAFEYFIRYQSSTAGTGIKLGCSYSGTATTFIYNAYGTTADITTNTALMDQDVLLTTGSTFSAWAARAESTTAPMISSGVDTINVDLLMRIEGLMVATTTGNLELYHASETAVSTSIMLDSSLRLTKFA